MCVYSLRSFCLTDYDQKSPDDFEEDDSRRFLPKFSKENFPKILAAVDKIKQVGFHHNATPGQVALAWILAQGDNVFVIPGTRKVKVKRRRCPGQRVLIFQVSGGKYGRRGC